MMTPGRCLDRVGGAGLSQLHRFSCWPVSRGQGLCRLPGRGAPFRALSRWCRDDRSESVCAAGFYPQQVRRGVDVGDLAAGFVEELRRTSSLFQGGLKVKAEGGVGATPTGCP